MKMTIPNLIRRWIQTTGLGAPFIANMEEPAASCEYWLFEFKERKWRLNQTHNSDTPLPEKITKIYHSDILRAVWHREGIEKNDRIRRESSRLNTSIKKPNLNDIKETLVLW